MCGCCKLICKQTKTSIQLVNEIEIQKAKTKKMKIETKVKMFELKGEYIELTALLKVLGLAETGGQAGNLVLDGNVTLNGQPESRKRAKIRTGDVVGLRGIKILVQ